jgi:hypothetical protein
VTAGVQTTKEGIVPNNAAQNAERAEQDRGQSAPKSNYTHDDLRRYARLIERHSVELNALVQRFPADKKYPFTAGLDDIELQLSGHVVCMNALLSATNEVAK